MGFFLLLRGVGMGGGTASVVLVPGVPGLEYKLKDTRLHYKVEDTRLHYHVSDEDQA